MAEDLGLDELVAANRAMRQAMLQAVQVVAALRSEEAEQQDEGLTLLLETLGVSFGDDPTDGTIWQRPQIPRPPHVESRSAPTPRAASSSDVPAGTRATSPDGVNTTRKVSPVAVIDVRSFQIRVTASV